MERKKDVHILSTWGDVKDPDVKSRFNEETKRKPNMIIDHNKSMGGIDKLDQFRSYYDVAGKKFWRYIFYTYFKIAILFFSKNQNRPTNAILYYLIKIPYYMPLLTLTPNPYPFLFHDVPGHRVVVYSSKRCVYCRDVLKCVQKTS